MLRIGKWQAEEKRQIGLLPRYMAGEAREAECPVTLRDWDVASRGQQSTHCYTDLQSVQWPDQRQRLWKWPLLLASETFWSC